MHDADRNGAACNGAGVVTDGIERRKNDHLDLCATDEVAFRDRTTLLEQVRFIHCALPELSLDEIDTSVSLVGKTLRLPLVISAMTGGTERAAEINRVLAEVADECGIGFGLGSQRAMQKVPETAWTYDVRKWAPNVLLFGNIGVVQAREQKTEMVAALANDLGVDAMCIHMNPAMELVQPGGDRDFRHGVDTYARYVRDLAVPVIAKETGSGISRGVANELVRVGVRAMDVSGAGGTSWVGVETLRADPEEKRLGEALWDWGIPTGASVTYCARPGVSVIATGGVKTGLDVAKAIALGATAGGIARPFLQAFNSGGRAEVRAFVDRVAREFRSVMLLVGAKNVEALRRAPRVLGSELERWIGVDG